MKRNNSAPQVKEWSYTWRDHEVQQLQGWQHTTHQQRLAWLEEALVLAHKSGALPVIPACSR